MQDRDIQRRINCIRINFIKLTWIKILSIFVIKRDILSMINLKEKENYICITVYIQYFNTNKGTFKNG